MPIFKLYRPALLASACISIWGLGCSTGTDTPPSGTPDTNNPAMETAVPPPPGDDSAPTIVPPPTETGGGDDSGGTATETAASSACTMNATLPFSADQAGAWIPYGYEGDHCGVSMMGTMGACPGHTIASATGKCWSVTLTQPAMACPPNATVMKWAGVVWQAHMGDWMDPPLPGTGINMCGATKVTFWAKGAKGTESVSFFAGSASLYPAGLKNQALTTTWTQYTMPITGMPDSNVTQGFGWTAADPMTTAATDTVSFQIDNIQWQ